MDRALVEPSSKVGRMLVWRFPGSIDVAQWLMRDEPGPNTEPHSFIDSLDSFGLPTILPFNHNGADALEGGFRFIPLNGGILDRLLLEVPCELNPKLPSAVDAWHLCSHGLANCVRLAASINRRARQRGQVGRNWCDRKLRDVVPVTEWRDAIVCFAK